MSFGLGSATKHASEKQDAGIPAYHGDGADCEALFYGTDAVAAAIGVKERNVREWWKKRPANLKKLGDT